MLGATIAFLMSYAATDEAHAAQQKLAGMLADADSVDFVHADRAAHQVAFGVELAGERYEIVASTRDDGVVERVAIHDLGVGSAELGALSWLSDAMHETRAIVRLRVDDEGQVTLITDDGTRYLAIPGHHGNHDDVVEAQWAAAWNS